MPSYRAHSTLLHDTLDGLNPHFGWQLGGGYGGLEFFHRRLADSVLGLESKLRDD
jgi:hypothetical protein